MTPAIKASSDLAVGTNGDVCLQLRGTHVRSGFVEDRDQPEYVTTDWDSAVGLPMIWYSQEIKASFVACQ